MASFDPLAYMPLMQSLVGALAGFLVAAFTVFITNRHTRQREARQAAEARSAERHRLYREKLEELLTLAQREGRVVTDGVHRVIEVQSAGETAEGYEQYRRHMLGAAQALQEALTLQQLYFPALASELEAVRLAVWDAWESLNAEVKRLRSEGNPSDAGRAAERQSFHDRQRALFARLWEAELALVAAGRAVVLDGLKD